MNTKAQHALQTFTYLLFQVMLYRKCVCVYHHIELSLGKWMLLMMLSHQDDYGSLFYSIHFDHVRSIIVY